MASAAIITSFSGNFCLSNRLHRLSVGHHFKTCQMIHKKRPMSITAFLALNRFISECLYHAKSALPLATLSVDTMDKQSTFAAFVALNR